MSEETVMAENKSSKKPSKNKRPKSKLQETKSTFREFKNLELPSFENNQEILFIYEDINNKRYKTKLHINNISNGKLFNDYKIVENEKPVLIDENKVTICNKGDLH